MAKQKTLPTEIEVLDYINTLPNERKMVEAIEVLELMKEITKLEPVMWGPSIIGFGSNHYKYESGHEGDAPLICFSPRKQKMVFYVLTKFKGQSQLLDKLGKHKTGSVCLYINKLADVDLGILEQILVACWNHAVENRK